MSSYSVSEKALHKLYLSNYFLSRATLDMEQILFGNKLKEDVPRQYVFVSGLARSGTTALMRNLFESEEYASLQYSNMPILLSPNLWKKKLKLESQERAHGDGIIIDGDSPEEFDEYFWKAFLKDSYINDGLKVHEIPDGILEKYKIYTGLVCLAKGKDKYISKNNNNILRIESLLSLPNSKIIMLFRDPLSHASSLLKLHRSFSQSQRDDPFELSYFNYLGHHEFGLGHKPFLLNEELVKRNDRYATDTLDYWILNWINYYEYLLKNLRPGLHLVAFEDLTRHPELVYNKLNAILEPRRDFKVPKRHFPGAYPEPKCDAQLKSRAINVYDTLKKQDILA